MFFKIQYVKISQHPFNLKIMRSGWLFVTRTLKNKYVVYKIRFKA